MAKELRMTQGIVKEALFNILGQSLSKRSLLDLYAGEGGVGIEALMRGAERVAFVEIERLRVRAIRERLKKMGREAKVYQGDVLSILKRIKLDFDIIFVDPPYSRGLVVPTLELISKVKPGPTTLVIVEHHYKEEIPYKIGPLRLSRERRYGETSLSFYEYGETTPIQLKSIKRDSIERGYPGIKKERKLQMKEVMLLRDYFKKREDVLMAFLFGSKAQKMSSKTSDWDIGVYLKSKTGILEWEETDCIYPQEDEIWNDLVDILKSEDIDLVVLNRAPANIASSVISGESLVIKDRGIFIDFMVHIKPWAEDYSNFVDSFYAVSQRSTSLTPKDKERLKKIINFLEQEMASYDYFSEFTFADYDTDIHKRRDVERWVENMVNSSIDIGGIILASVKKRVPDYYKDIFLELKHLRPFSESKVDEMAKWVKLRNILAHEYLDIRWNRIERFIKDSKELFPMFLRIVKEFVKDKNDETIPKSV